MHLKTITIFFSLVALGVAAPTPEIGEKRQAEVKAREPAPNNLGGQWPYEYYVGYYPKKDVERRSPDVVARDEPSSTVAAPGATPTQEYTVGRVPDGVKVEGAVSVNGPLDPQGPKKWPPVPHSDPI